MTDISSFMTADHKDCDDSFVEFENAIATQNWPDLTNSWTQFAKKLLHHFEMEETVLFPEFESATGMTQGPTAIMRAEHIQMRSLISTLESAIESQDTEQCQGIAETLMIMMQQHNMKEEQMLYPMTDQHIDSNRVVSAMKSIV